MANCSNCGGAIPDGQETFVQRNNDKTSVALCSNCATSIENTFKAETENPNLKMALLYGLAVALVSSLVWYGIVVVTNYQLGIIAVAVGWLVARGTMEGAGKKRGFHLQGMSVSITIASMAFSEYLIVRHFVAQALAEMGFTEGISLLLPADKILGMITAGINADPITLLFWGIALWTAFKVPAKRSIY